MNIWIIGGGNMGTTYARAFVNSHVVKAEQLTILEKEEPKKIQHLREEELARIVTSSSDIGEAHLIILAVKPQDAPVLFSQIRPYVTPSQVVLSIMAGIDIPTIQAQTGLLKVIRAMPNLPAQIGMGMTVFASSPEVTRLEEGAIQNLLTTTGKTLSVSEETQINCATAISGSGPAYIYYFMDAMIQAASEMGIAPAEAELMVAQTFRGALQLFQQNSYTCKEWINRVASKGGTTEAALSAFGQHQLDLGIKAGAKAALERAIELGTCLPSRSRQG